MRSTFSIKLATKYGKLQSLCLSVMIRITFLNSGSLGTLCISELAKASRNHPFPRIRRSPPGTISLSSLTRSTSIFFRISFFNFLGKKGYHYIILVRCFRHQMGRSWTITFHGLRKRNHQRALFKLRFLPCWVNFGVAAMAHNPAPLQILQDLKFFAWALYDPFTMIIVFGFKIR